MSNRESFPPSASPLTGDIDGGAGDTTVTVVGIQTQSVSSAVPVDKDIFRYNAAVPQWEPKADGNSSITLGTYVTAGGEVVSRGVTLSDDYEVLVDNVSLEGLVGWTYGFASQFFVDGTAI